MTQFDRVDEVLRGAAGVEFTGAVARIEHRGRLVFERAYGATRADAEGYAHPPESPGIGVDWDWDFIEKCTTKKV